MLPLLRLTITVGVLTPSVLLTWISLEVSLLLFLSLLSMTHTSRSTKEDILYYFISQALGRTLILFSWVVFIKTNLSSWVINVALVLKIGLFPFHSWYLNIVNIINYSNFWILRVPLKLITLKIFYTLRSRVNSLILGTLNILASFIFVFKEKKPILFLALTSIFNTGWAMLGLTNSWVWIVYIIIYGLNLKLVLVSLEISFKLHLINRSVHEKLAYENQVLLRGLIIMGIPPFTGFALKVIIFLDLIEQSWRVRVLVILSSLIMLFYYLLFFFYSLRLGTSYSEKISKNYAYGFIRVIVIINLWISLLLIIWLIHYLNNEFNIVQILRLIW